MTVTQAARLSRASEPALGRPAPVRIVHLGLGAFHRAHQAWYTAHATDASAWGIAAFTVRSSAAADQLAPQDGLFTLVQRGPDGDVSEVVPSIVQALPGSDVASFVTLLADPQVAILTMTITEAGYRLTADGLADLDDAAVAADMALLRAGLDGGSGPSTLRPTTALGRVVLGLEARRRADAPSLAVVPCDNLPDNGPLVRRALESWADAVSPELRAWLPRGISVVSTSVDRITPRTTAADREAVTAATGRLDEGVVVAEPFSDWVLSGEFPSGRPDWASAGARFVDDIVPWQTRKLWMLNGAHTLLASLGLLRGHRLVSEAIADPVCRDAVERLWDEDARHLAHVDSAAYREALLARFGNPRIAHGLDQIATDATTKIALRIVPVALRELAEGRSPIGCAAAIAAWILGIRRGVHAAPDGLSAENASVARLVRALDSRLAQEPEFCAEVGTRLHLLEDDLPAPGAPRLPESHHRADGASRKDHR